MPFLESPWIEWTPEFLWMFTVFQMLHGVFARGYQGCQTNRVGISESLEIIFGYLCQLKLAKLVPGNFTSTQ